jgi:hypothetical protein
MTQRHITVLISFRSTKTKQLASFLYFLLLTVAPFPIAEQDATPTGCCAKPLASPQALSVSSPSQPSSSMAASLRSLILSSLRRGPRPKPKPGASRRPRLSELVPPSVVGARRPPFFSSAGSSTATRLKDGATPQVTTTSGRTV